MKSKIFLVFVNTELKSSSLEIFLKRINSLEIFLKRINAESNNRPSVDD